MITPEDFEILTRLVARTNNLDLDTAAEYLSLVGDTPELDESGRVSVINEDGEKIATIKFPE
jgi:hypothetical protein